VERGHSSKTMAYHQPLQCFWRKYIRNNFLKDEMPHLTLIPGYLIQSEHGKRQLSDKQIFMINTVVEFVYLPDNIENFHAWIQENRQNPVSTLDVRGIRAWARHLGSDEGEVTMPSPACAKIVFASLLFIIIGASIIIGVAVTLRR
jgi:hypothetical protein